MVITALVMNYDFHQRFIQIKQTYQAELTAVQLLHIPPGRAGITRHLSPCDFAHGHLDARHQHIHYHHMQCNTTPVVVGIAAIHSFSN